MTSATVRPDGRPALPLGSSTPSDKPPATAEVVFVCCARRCRMCHGGVQKVTHVSKGRGGGPAAHSPGLDLQGWVQGRGGAGAPGTAVRPASSAWISGEQSILHAVDVTFQLATPNPD